MAGLGFFAGGVARGLESAEQAQQGRRELAMRSQQIAADKELRNVALGIDQRREERLQQNEQVSQANEIIAKEMEIIAKTVEAAKLQNAAPEKIAKSVLPLLQDVQRLAGVTGADPNAYAAQVDALVTAPTAAEAAAAKGEASATAKISESKALTEAGVATGNVLEQIKAKIARGEELQPGERTLYNDSLRQSSAGLVELLKALGATGEVTQ